jgi:hypothetical protein
VSNKNLELMQQLNKELDQIVPPDSLHETIRKRILEDKRPNNSIKSRNKLYFAYSLTVVFIILGGGFVSPAFATILQKLPVIGFIYNNFQSDIGLKKAKETGMTEDYQKSVESNNIELTITETYFDGVNLSVGYKLKNNSDEEWQLPPKIGAGATHFLLLKGGNHEFEINGSRVYGGFSDEYEVIGPNEYEGILNFYPHEFPEGNNFTLGLSYTEIMGVNGEWVFDIPVSKKKVEELEHSFLPNQKVNGLGGEITIKSVTFTPTGTELKTETIMEKGRGKDILFSIKELGADNGVSGYTEPLGNAKEITVSRSTFPPLKKIPGSITITAYSTSDTSKEITFTVQLTK